MPWHVVSDHPECQGKFAVVANDTDELVSCHASRESAERRVAWMYAKEGGGGEYMAAAAMSSASVNDLPDSAFAYIEPGGSKDADGKTTPRSLRHFPIHDEAHVRNALSRASQSPFGDKAMSKIRAAARRLGITVSAAAMPATLTGVELARPGTWYLSSGKRTFTDQMLRDAADFYLDSGRMRIPLGFGHTDNRFDGEPAFGWVDNIRYHSDEQGPVLLGDLVDVDDWVAAAAPRRWPNRSVEGFANLDFRGRTYTLALNRVALLGATPPAMPVLRSLADLREAVAAAAAAQGAEYIAASLLAPSEQDTLTPATEADVSPTRKRETGMAHDPALIREALGLDDDASDDEVREELAAAGFLPAVVAPAVTDTPAPVAASAAPTVTTTPGTMTIDASAWDEREERIRRLEAADALRRKDQRDQIIAKAVQDGKFPPSRKQYWQRLWDDSPEVTRQVIEGLTPNVVPVMASGYDADGVPQDDELDREIAKLSLPTKVGGK